MSKINIKLNDVVNGKLISFIAPCESDIATCLTINGVDYTICDVKNNNIGCTSGLWINGAIVSVIINTETNRAYIQGTAIASTYTVSVPLSWTGNGTSGYYQTIMIQGILGIDTPIVDVVLGDDIDANVLYLDAWACVTRITTSDNSITIYAKDKPTSAFTIQLKVVR